MFDYTKLVLGRLKHDEAVDGCRESYVPLNDRLGFVWRLLAALHGGQRERVQHPDRADQSQRTRAGAVA